MTATNERRLGGLTVELRPDNRELAWPAPNELSAPRLDVVGPRGVGLDVVGLGAGHPRERSSGCEWNRSRSREREAQAGEDAEVGVKLDAGESTGAERGERVVVLQAAELALYGDAAVVVDRHARGA